jgi:hypothetical protein
VIWINPNSKKLISHVHHVETCCLACGEVRLYGVAWCEDCIARIHRQGLNPKTLVDSAIDCRELMGIEPDRAPRTDLSFVVKGFCVLNGDARRDRYWSELSIFLHDRKKVTSIIQNFNLN